MQATSSSRASLLLTQNYEPFNDAAAIAAVKQMIYNRAYVNLTATYEPIAFEERASWRMGDFTKLGQNIQNYYVLDFAKITENKMILERDALNILRPLTDNSQTPTKAAINAAHVISCVNPQDLAVKAAKSLIAAANVLNIAYQRSLANQNLGGYFHGHQLAYNQVLEEGCKYYQSLLATLESKISVSNALQHQRLTRGLAGVGLDVSPMSNIDAALLLLNSNQPPTHLDDFDPFAFLKGAPDLGALPPLPNPLDPSDPLDSSDPLGINALMNMHF